PVSVAHLVAGGLLIVVATVDALWTTLWVDGHAGPLTTRYASGVRWLYWRLVPAGRHRLLSLTGPLVLTASVLTWTLLMWAGWWLLFGADPRSLADARTGEPAGPVGRLY